MPSPLEPDPKARPTPGQSRAEERQGRIVRGRVMRLDAKVAHVDVDGEVRLCATRGKLFENLGTAKNPVTVGDWVDVDPTGDPQSIEAVHPRTNHLGRVASAHDPREQILFANVDHMYVIASVAKPGFSSNRTDRILAACRDHAIPVTLILNKIDLDKKGITEDLLATYANAGIELLTTSATGAKGGAPANLDALRASLRGRTSAFYGASGVGKSTLLNALEPSLDLKVGKISSYWTAGKHTTTFSQLHRLFPGEEPASWVIDTPGIRVFRPYGLTPERLRDLFGEFAEFQKRCHFPNCSHDHEPDCAVYDAVEDGLIAPTRFASYMEMLDELRGAPDLGEAPEEGEPA